MWIIVFENIGHKYDFEVELGGGGWSLFGSWGWFSSKKTNISYQSAVPYSDVIKSKLQLI